MAEQSGTVEHVTIKGQQLTIEDRPDGTTTITLDGAPIVAKRIKLSRNWSVGGFWEVEFVTPPVR